MKSHRTHKRGFTLVELLVVIGLIAVLAGGIGLAFSGGNKSNALQAGQGMLQSLVSAVRGQAALSGNDAALFVDTATSNIDQQTYLRKFVIAAYDSSISRWKVVGDSSLLPAGVYLVPESGVGASGYKTTGGVGTTATQLYYSDGIEPYTGNYTMVLKLSSRGTKASGGATSQIVLSTAETVPNSDGVLSLEFKHPELVRGAIISNYGVLTPVNDESAFE